MCRGLRLCPGSATPIRRRRARCASIRSSAVMLVVVNTVWRSCTFYSIGYMARRHRQPLFFAELSLFTFAMLSLVTAITSCRCSSAGRRRPNDPTCSSVLVSPACRNSAAIKAFVVNRVGDLFAHGISANHTSHDVNSTVFARRLAKACRADRDRLSGRRPHRHMHLMLMGAMRKSAQFLLHTWLPDAMEGPTPLSALINAASMVTAGVMVARASPLFELLSDRNLPGCDTGRRHHGVLRRHVGRCAV